jgi:hypothetical protein
MKRKGRRKKTKSRRAKHSNQSKSIKSPSPNYGWFKSSWKVLVGLATLLGLVVTLYSLSARVAVSSDSPLDPNDPFSSPFTVENLGILPIYEVHFACTLKNVKWQDGGVINIRTRTDADPIKQINAGEATTTFCRFLPYRAKIKGADIEVEVKYRPAYLFWSKGSSFRFGTVKERDGTLRWVPRALSE